MISPIQEARINPCVHAETTETFLGFLRANKNKLAIVVSIWTTIYLAGLFAADVHYFYSGLFNDPLLYYLHGWYLLHYHTAAARLADNIPPFQYVGIPGYVRIPLIAASRDFAIQLRLIQVTNLVLLSAVGLLSSYLLQLGLPAKWKKLAIPWMFGSLLLTTAWELNVFLPLSDILFSLFFCGALVAIRSVRMHVDGFRFDRKLLLIAFLVAIAASIKFFGFLLPIYAALSWLPSLRSKNARRKASMLAMTMACVAGTVILLMWRTIQVYSGIWINRVATTRGHDWLINLVAISIPCQIVPSFYYLYSPSLTSNHLAFNWTASNRDVLVLVAGLAITTSIVIGAFLLRRTFLPEICLFLMFLPVAAPIATSTTRYLLPFQFLSISCFLAAIRLVFRRWTPLMEQHKYASVSFVAAILLAAAVFHGLGSRGQYTSISSLYGAEENISATYTALDSFLSRIDAERSRLLYFPLDPAAPGKWSAIRRLHYLAPDDKLQQSVQDHSVYAVFDYPRKLNTRYMEGDDRAMLATLSHWGKFKAQLVLDASNPSAFGRIYRITIDDHQITPGSPVSDPASALDKTAN